MSTEDYEIQLGSGRVSYSTIRRAIEETDSDPFDMSLTGDDAQYVFDAVNKGIDSHLEACFCPDRGDSYDWDDRTIGNTVVCTALSCNVSAESLPVLIRRLSEEAEDLDASNLAESILMVLGIDEYGEYVGREALGLE